MRALVNVTIEPALRVFEVSIDIINRNANQAARRVLRVLADTPQGALRIARWRYPRSTGLRVLSGGLPLPAAI
ncbi:hypothetical protein [Derxia gummosa]|uniref:Uncharacterized protein n=1 Tax=Derxia gummosa DSM 723 TaxID=1121388 RepID=A0A8B6XC31_9BURK|nr:hypothetical protein [Derxia gummosa]